MTLDWPGKQPPKPHAAQLTTEEIGGSGAVAGRLDHGDNLAVMANWLESHAGEVALIYLDPPFASGKPRTGRGGTYDDPAGPAALQALYERLWLARALLRDDGSLLLHCDHRLSPALALVCDELFGRGDRGPGSHQPGFRNELIWHYGLGGSSRRSYPKKHDSILWYTKGRTWTFHAPLVPATSQKLRGQLKHEPDVWVMPSLNNQSRERCGYPTQKPLALLEKLIAAHSDPGDVVADPYAGSGTTAVAARRLGRRWLACEQSAIAVEATRARLLDEPAATAWTLRRSAPRVETKLNAVVGQVVRESRKWRLEGVLVAGEKLALEQVAGWSVGPLQAPGEPFRACWHTSRSRPGEQLETVAELPAEGISRWRLRFALCGGEVGWDTCPTRDT